MILLEWLHLEAEQEGPEDDEDEDDVHDRVGEDDQGPNDGQGRVVDVGIHHEVPRDGQGAEGDDGGVGVVLAAGRRGSGFE